MRSNDTQLYDLWKAHVHGSSPIKEALPFTHVSFVKDPVPPAMGEMGCLIMAGGQGSRLGWKGPKGTFCINNKSLFEYQLEQAQGPVAIMTSPENDQETRAFIKKLGYEVDFFVQETLPLLDDEGELLFQSKDQVAMGPAGNGGALKSFYDSGLWEKWWNEGIRYLNLMPIDNLLANPFDYTLLDFLIQTESDIVIKGIKRKREKVGAIAQINGQIRVIEYSELPSSIHFPYASLSLFCMTMEFAKRTETLPLHLAHKQVESFGKKVWAYKFERFIFDILDYATKTSVLIYPREKCFAPIKTPEDVKQALIVCSGSATYP